MEDMPTGKLLWCLVRPISLRWCTLLTLRNHLLPTDDARVVAKRCHVLRRGVGVHRIHVASSTSIPDEIGAPREERPEGHVHVSENMKGQAVV